MELLLTIGFICLVILIVSSMSKQQAKKGPDNVITVEKKQCPPHQWFWQEIVDQHGNSQGARICCKVCGPLNSQDGI